MTTRLARLIKSVLLLTLLVPGVAYAQVGASVANSKLDESLRQNVQQGCVGTTSVIVRTKPGYRQGLRDSLTQHGDLVKGEFPELDAVAAEVHCDDLSALAGFTTVYSVSSNARVGAQALSITVDLSAAQAAVEAAKSALTSAKDAAKVAQANVQAAEAAVQKAQANLTAAQKALAKASTVTKALAQANVFTAQVAVKAAQDALTAAHTRAVRRRRRLTHRKILPRHGTRSTLRALRGRLANARAAPHET